MASDPPSQRAYKALCPNCGAPVEFRSAASASAVCSFCRSTLVRDGDALRRIGVSGELFDDHSPLQLGASGTYQGAAFTLVGRLQYGYDGGTWNEWHALFDNGRSGWLSEDNGRYVFAFDAPAAVELPALAALAAGQRQVVDGRPWGVASVTSVRLLAAQGELPRPPKLDGAFTVADLRNNQGEVGTLDYGDPAKPQWSVGRSVALSELAMRGLAEASEKTLKGRGIACPNCGAALEVTLASTKSITCGQCKSVVDVSRGVGTDLAFFKQNVAGDSGLEPQIPLGSVGTLRLGPGEALPWQVVGYLERCELAAPGDDDEQSFWREYLLYHRTAGFAFLVDAEDGWSWVVPITGAPEGRGDKVSYQGVDYRKLYSYDATTTYVLGEFYWRVERHQRGSNIDYVGTGANRHKRLNREATPGEVVWSGGETIEANTVAAAFRIPQAQRAALQRDALPAGPGLSAMTKIIIAVVLILLLLWLVSRCSSDDCAQVRNTYGEASLEYQQCQRSSHGVSSGRSWGGSWGGYSSGGGGHK